MFANRFSTLAIFGLALSLAGCGRDTKLSEDVAAAHVAAERAEAAQRAAEHAAAVLTNARNGAPAPAETVAASATEQHATTADASGDVEPIDPATGTSVDTPDDGNLIQS